MWVLWGKGIIGVVFPILGTIFAALTTILTCYKNVAE